MSEFEVPCRNPFDGRPSRVRIRLDGEDFNWCNADFVRSAVCTAFTAAGRAWWDARSVYCAQPGRVCAVPWLTSPVVAISPGVYRIEIPPGYESLYIADGWAWLAPKGYPPNADYLLSEVERARVEENMRMTFGRHGVLSSEDTDKIYRAFEAVYVNALLNAQIHLRCSTRSCGTDTVAWWGTGIIRLCPRFFDISEASAASTIIEELLHGYADIDHPGSPPVDEADYYQNYVLAHYLS